MSDSAQDPMAMDEGKAGEGAANAPERFNTGKGKAPENPMETDDDDDDDDDDDEPEGEPEEDLDEDNMEEIDTDNIISSRTRGKEIDYAEAAKELAGEDDEDDDDDGDFEGEDAMEE